VSRTIFVANLPYSTDDQELKELFQGAGPVESARIAYDRGTQRHRGFGFVVMETEEAHDRAVATFSGYRFKGRDLVVNEARPRHAASNTRR
jgi:RNA recognition motif-containing protein